MDVHKRPNKLIYIWNEPGTRELYNCKWSNNVVTCVSFVVRLKMLETGQFHKLAGRGKKKADMDKYTNKAEIKTYNSAADSTLPVKQEPSAADSDPETEETKPKKKKVRN